MPKEEKWERYLEYLKNWAIDHKDIANFGMSPVCFNEWEDNELEEEVE